MPSETTPSSDACWAAWLRAMALAMKQQIDTPHVLPSYRDEDGKLSFSDQAFP